jgi:hypothetical protein
MIKKSKLRIERANRKVHEITKSTEQAMNAFHGTEYMVVMSLKSSK